jgi:hypothetical protein
MVLAGVLQSFENCVFAKIKAQDHCKFLNQINKPVSCIIYKDATETIIEKFAFKTTLEIHQADKLSQMVHTPQQIFCMTKGNTSDFPYIEKFDYSKFELIDITI